jgi:subtilisin family serine protease
VRRDHTSPDDTKPVDRRINRGCKSLPAELPGVVTVSSFARIRDTLRTKLSSFSNTGLGVIDVAAPGSDILSTVGEHNGYAWYSGTSMASPHVAGVLALMRSAHPDWTSDQLIAALEAQANDKACRDVRYAPPCVGTTADNSYAGEGMVDALEAVSP